MIEVWKDIKGYSSRAEASRKLNLCISGISLCISGKYKHCGGYIWTDKKRGDANGQCFLF